VAQGADLHRLDPATGAIERTRALLPRRRSADLQAIDEARGSVAVASGRLAIVLDAGGHEAGRATVRRGAYAVAAAFRGRRLLVAGGRRLWAVTGDRAATGSVRTPARIAAMAVDGRIAWVGGAGYVWPLDAATGAHAGPRSAVTAGPWGIAAEGGIVWVADGDGLTRIDPATGRAAVHRDEPADLVAMGDGALWTLTYDGRLTRRDPATGRPVAGPVVIGGDDHELAQTLVAGGGAVWVGLRHPAVLRDDPATGRIVWRRDIPYT
jgi:hypothetical protein